MNEITKEVRERGGHRAINRQTTDANQSTMQKKSSPEQNTISVELPSYHSRQKWPPWSLSSAHLLAKKYGGGEGGDFTAYWLT